jgi:5'-deoxynucleotidase YfbR-like HD superfamily hydrolase
MLYTMGKKLPAGTSEALIALGGLAMQFATIQRATYLADGSTHESDTDHTVMLGLMACAFAATYEPSLDIGKVAQFALVHDLVEAYAGDTDTFNMTSDKHHSDKAAREAVALARIQKEFDATLPWISKTISEYESLESPEARFIKTLDKTLPKVTRFVNNDAMNTDAETFNNFCNNQIEAIKAGYGKDQEIVCSFYSYLQKKVYALMQKKTAPATD